MKVNVLFYSVNDELYNTDRTAQLGPYDMVQMTYDTLRDDTGQIIAAFDTQAEDWCLTERQPIEGSAWADNVPIGEHYSDFEITPVQER